MKQKEVIGWTYMTGEQIEELEISMEQDPGDSLCSDQHRLECDEEKSCKLIERLCAGQIVYERCRKVKVEIMMRVIDLDESLQCVPENLFTKENHDLRRFQLGYYRKSIKRQNE